jgi:hypothetical protein
MTISSTFSMGKGPQNEGHQLTRFLSCSNLSETNLLKSLREHLLCVHSPVAGCASFFLPSASDFLGAISGSACRLPRVARGLRGEGRGDLGGWDFSERMTAERGLVWGFLRLLANCRLEAQSFLTIAAGLNNQLLGKVYCFEDEELFLGIFQR